MPKTKNGLILKNSKAFTLIELLVVIAIIGILAAIILIAVNTARNKGKNARIKQEMNDIRKHAMIYEDDHQGFLETPPNPTPNVSGYSDIGKLETDIESLGATIVWGNITQITFAVTATNMPGGGAFCVDYTTVGNFYSGGAPGTPANYDNCPAIP